MLRLFATHSLVQTSVLLLGLTAAAGQAGSLNWKDQPGHRFAAFDPAPEGRVGFQALSPQVTGIDFTNQVPAERHYANQILLNGSGVAAGDVDGDGWCDVFFCGLGGGSKLYRNLGDWKFQNVTAASGLSVGGSFDATGAALADFDGDGDLDLIINSVGQGTLVFLNDGRGRFAPSPAGPSLNRGTCGSSLALADIDGDGRLDLYIANYRTTTIRDQPNARFTFKTVEGRPVPEAFGGRPLSSPDLANRFSFHFKPGPGGGGSVLHDELGEPDLFCRNEGGGKFTPLPFTGSTFLDEQGKPLPQTPLDWGLSVMMRDFNGDGAPDIYVCNDFATPDRFWINDGRGRFRAAPVNAIRQTSLSTMAIDVADINRDGFDDFFTVDMLSREHRRRLVQRNEANPNMHLFFDVTLRPQSPRNTLQLGRGDGTFAEIAQMAGLEAAEWAWASIFLDVDLDGYEDLLVANGFERDYMNMDANRRVKEMQARGGPRMPLLDQQRLNEGYPRLDTANAAFRNLGNLRFADVSAEWAFDVRAVSQGMCLADLDNDGDMDVLINNSNGAATALRNNTTAPRVAVRLKGKAPNTRGIGAKIKLIGGAVPTQSQEMISGGRYLSSDDPMRVFAAGAATNRLTLEVTWRNGTRSVLTNAQANRIYEIDEAGAGPSFKPAVQVSTPIFKDVSALLAHTNTQEAFDDFARQPLLPNKLSTLGPGASWFDVDADGWDDLVIAGGKGGKMAVYRNDGRGGFSRTGGPSFDQTLARAQTAVLGWRKADGKAALIAGSSNYEDGVTNGSVAMRYDLGGTSNLAGGTTIDASLSGSPASTGPMAMADVDGDGELDLFVGGRCVPGRWPEAAPSLMFRQVTGKWILDQENTRQLVNAGLVSGAVFTDFDGDGDPDLAVACEWGPVRVYRNDRGKLLEATTDLGLDQIKGWWNGVATGDFDGDGRLDLLASNWGYNTKYEGFRSRPLRVHFGDLNGDGRVNIVENWYDDAQKKYVPIFNVWTMSRSMPWLLERFPNFESFSRAGVEEALGERMRAAQFLEAGSLDSMVFFNRGARFEARTLPTEAQAAPVFGICVADFDGDGNEDAFLSQNFFATRTETSRYDAGRGLLLRGDGRGGFAAADGPQSGLLIYGEQRGVAAGDYDRDGRTDLVVTQVGAETKLYRNETARPGLRVRLVGPPGNSQGIGAVMRLKFGEQLGPAREVHAGSGYWSQDSAAQVMTGTKPPTGVWIRWPGGRITDSKLSGKDAEIAVTADGEVRVVR